MTVGSTSAWAGGSGGGVGVAATGWRTSSGIWATGAPGTYAHAGAPAGNGAKERGSAGRVGEGAGVGRAVLAGRGLCVALGLSGCGEAASVTPNQAAEPARTIAAASEA